MSDQKEPEISNGASQNGVGVTKYDELLAASRAAGQRWQNYELRSYAIAHAMRASIASFLSLKIEAVTFRPVIKPAKDATVYSAAGAMEVGSDDTYWHFGLVVPIGLQRIFFRFLMKQTPQGPFAIKPYWLRAGAPVFEVADEKSDFYPIAQWVFDQIRDHFDRGFDRFIAAEGGPPSIGFLSKIQ
jgi:hypothetical protein